MALRFQKTSPEELQQWFQDGRVRLDGQAVEPAQRLQPGQTLSLLLPGHQEDRVDIRWRTLWENDELLVAYKPPLLPVSRTTRNLYNTLIQLVRRQTPWYDAHLLHRLDTETGGLIVLAKNKAADKKWKPRLAELIERKLYHARVYGVPDWRQKLMDCQLSEKVGSAIRSQMYVVDDSCAELFTKPKSSRTGFRVLSSDQQQSIIECELFTGRKHQIRAQLAHLGHPIVADKIYAHAGRYYLQRLERPLTVDEFEQLGGEHHQLTAVQLDIRPDPAQPVISLRL